MRKRSRTYVIDPSRRFVLFELNASRIDVPSRQQVCRDAKGSRRRKHDCSSDNYRNSLTGTLTRLRIVLFAIDPITNAGTGTGTDTGANTITNANAITGTNTVTNAGRNRINRQGRAHDDHNGLRSESCHRRCWRGRHLDEQ